MRKYYWLIVALPMLSSCRHFWGKRVHGNGNIKTEERTVSSFKNLEVSSSFNVYLTQGDLKPVKIEGDENLSGCMVSFQYNDLSKVITRIAHVANTRR